MLVLKLAPTWLMIPNASARLPAYLAVGAAAFVIDIAITLWLAAHMPIVAANTIGFVAANLANFLLGHWFVFGGMRTWAGIRNAYAAVFGISLVGLALSDLLIWAFTAFLTWPAELAKVVTTVLVLGWNFSARSRWIYRTS